MEEKEREQQNQVEDYCSHSAMAIDVVYDFFRVQFPTPIHNVVRERPSVSEVPARPEGGRSRRAC
jgi:hypothetical protein